MCCLRPTMIATLMVRSNGVVADLLLVGRAVGSEEANLAYIVHEQRREDGRTKHKWWPGSPR